MAAGTLAERGLDTQRFLMCAPLIVREARRVARSLLTDHLRVDVLIRGDCEEIFVSEVE
eukprot:CAMPEP_0180797826 /NCGR_PEP_ID=MMETSP1038_2-20121128/57594_1 /TAXON_ID=632150 /ORGANISM="Azadinium spinosum, Strain 3D9" /LENGTH=58 /DNA_ID=CAMNT_0022837147 /DNA_START=44 /DNA_END=217 /DNA_ORIENTATION=-